LVFRADTSVRLYRRFQEHDRLFSKSAVLCILIFRKVPDVAETFETGNRKDGRAERKEALAQGRKGRHEPQCTGEPGAFPVEFCQQKQRDAGTDGHLTHQCANC